MKKWFRRWMLLLLLISLSVVHPTPVAGQSNPVRRVYAPYFTGEIKPWRTAVFWFGRVTPTENSVDVRVGYNEDELYLRTAVFDRLLWFDSDSPSENLDEWDAISIYLDPGTGTAYRFVTQLSTRAVFVNQGSGWTEAEVPFSVFTVWRGSDWNNNDVEDRGWGGTFQVSFVDLGLPRTPNKGTQWRLAVAVHDRDDAEGTVIPDKVWPESFDRNEPSNWGELVFGLPSYTPQPASAGGTAVIREGVEGAVVPDAAVGGTIPHLCGEGLDNAFWTEWPTLNYGDEGGFSIHNQADMADWPCFARYYVSFPLDTLPPGKTIVSATLTLHHWGNAAWEAAYPSYIWAYSVQGMWDEGTITWNNAPLAVDNLDVVRVDVLTPGNSPGFPGVPYHWDVTQAVAEAYAAGRPVNLALYSSDTAYNSGKYFLSSEDESVEGRPILNVVWDDALAKVHKDVWPPAPTEGQVVKYTLALLGNGQALTLTDDLPTQVSAPGLIEVSGGSIADYDGKTHRLTWNDSPDVGEPVTITFPVTVQVAGPLAVYNTAVLTDAKGRISTDRAVFIVDPHCVWLPLVMRD
jgi:hypothetical protein